MKTPHYTKIHNRFQLKGYYFSADELITMMQELGIPRDNIKLSERLVPWSVNEEQEDQQMSWLVQVSL